MWTLHLSMLEHIRHPGAPQQFCVFTRSVMIYLERVRDAYSCGTVARSFSKFAYVSPLPETGQNDGTSSALRGWPEKWRLGLRTLLHVQLPEVG